MEINEKQSENGVIISKQLFIRTIKDDVTKHYEMVKKLGEGSYGKIYLVLNKESNDLRAMKQIVKSKVGDLEVLKREIEILSIVDHPNIVRLFEIFEDDTFFYLIMEYCSGNDLYSKIKERTLIKKPFTEKEIAIIMKQLISAIAYCHEKGICHRDLKLENILFSTSDPDSEIKVIDFGCSVLRKPKLGGDNNKSSNMKTKVGTVYYISPEIIKGNYDEKCDIWACGVILFVLLFGYQPFSGNNDKEIYQNIINVNFEFPKKKGVYISKQIQSLIQNMICPANKRYTAIKVLKDRWLVSFSKTTPIPIPLAFDENKLSLFKKYNIVKKLSLIFIASRLNYRESKRYKDIFMAFNENQIGVITKEDFQNLFYSKECTKNFSDEQISSLFNALDLDKNGEINYTEFLACYMEKAIFTKEENLKEAFNTFSRNDIGIISKNEMLRCFNLEPNSKNSELVIKLIELNDFNNDGRIDYADFCKMIKRDY